QTSDRGATTHSPVATPAWPDPPAVATVTAQEATAPPRDIRTESLRPTVDTSVSDDSKTTAWDSASTTSATPTMATSASRMPVEIVAILALGLVVAGVLLRVVMKISSRRRQRRIDDQVERELQQDQIVPQRNALNEYLQRSTIPTANDANSRRLTRVSLGRPDITRARDSVISM